MTAKIPEDFADLIGPPVIPTLASSNADGTLQASPVWATRDGDDILVGSAHGRVKDRNLRERPHVALCFVDPANPYRHLSVTGIVEQIADEDVPEQASRVTGHIDDAAEAYVGQRPYPYRSPGEIRSLFRIRPERIATYP
jgi:PPOX class probable F420-dependent enzyme